jgi:hypothetical protein
MNSHKWGCGGPRGVHGPKGDWLAYFLKLFYIVRF